ncbi:MAG: aldehyde:ferredoxin oxidoreductase, partial [Deltaproteobacteria bacterium]|nr:aldehyde:ferredoxin oxidoreductase [Deltaproteobacteria bacterium]
MKGFFGQILRINVAEQTFGTEPIDEEVLKRYLGGKGLSTHLLLKENPAGVDPLAPENTLILAVGPVSGSSI